MIYPRIESVEVIDMRFPTSDNKDGRRRREIVREEIGSEHWLMIDAYQRWDVPQAAEWVRALAVLLLPTASDYDITMHRASLEQYRFPDGPVWAQRLSQ